MMRQSRSGSRALRCRTGIGSRSLRSSMCRSPTCWALTMVRRMAGNGGQRDAHDLRPLLGGVRALAVHHSDQLFSKREAPIPCMVPAGDSQPSPVLSPRPGVLPMTPGPNFLSWSCDVPPRENIPGTLPACTCPGDGGRPKHGDRVSGGNGGTYEVVGASKGSTIASGCGRYDVPVEHVPVGSQGSSCVCPCLALGLDAVTVQAYPKLCGLCGKPIRPAEDLIS